MPKVTAILVAYNSASVLGQTLASLQAEAEIASIVVVDNASGDGTCTLVQSRFPAVRLIKNTQNEGFGRANNQALALTATPYALLINPDARLKPGALDALLQAAERYSDAAIIAPMLYDEAGNIDASYKRNVFAREKKRGAYVLPQGDSCAEFLSGAVWLLNMRLMQKVGFFDPAIFLYYEDDDLCMRARQMGYGVVLAHAAAAVHLKGASSGKENPQGEFFKQKHMAWSRLYIERKYRGGGAAARLKWWLSLTYAAKMACYALALNKRKYNRYRGRYAGVRAFNG